MTRISRFSALVAMAAATSMVATPATAADMNASRSSVSAPAYGAWDSDSQNAAAHRRYRGYRDRTSVGDVLAGVLIIGTVAAVASAASKSSQDRNYRGQPYPSRPYPDSRYPERPYDYRADRGSDRYDDSRGIDRAVDMCVREVERDVRVRGVDEVERSGDGWRVSGTLYNGDDFSCKLGADGRIDDIDYSGRNSDRTFGQNDRVQNSAGGNRQGEDGQGEDRQWSDDRYASAWDNSPQRTASAPSANLPAYPGGPVAGSEDYGADTDPGDGYVDGNPNGDGRYGTSGVDS